jgi:hypothetical protein
MILQFKNLPKEIELYTVYRKPRTEMELAKAE